MVPDVSATAAEAAAAAIERRRTRHDGGAIAQLPDDLLGRAAHVGRHRGLPPDELRRDVMDAWLICDYLERELVRTRLGLVRALIGCGMTYRQIGAELFGGASRAAVEATVRRYESVAGGGEPREAPARAGRRHGRAAQARARAAQDATTTMIRALKEHQAELPDLDDDLDDLFEAYARLGPGSEVVLARLRQMVLPELEGRVMSVGLRAAVNTYQGVNDSHEHH